MTSLARNNSLPPAAIDGVTAALMHSSVVAPPGHSFVTTDTIRKRRRRRPGPATWLVTTVVLAMLVYAVAWPIARAVINESLATDAGVWDLGEQLRIRSLQAMTVVWLFFFGACLGSFLNVVIYRCPRGQTLLGTSLCPFCRQPIRFRHNLPVLGWLILRGRCRDCQLPISVRYPLVEATVGTIFLSLALVELFTGGRNLPSLPLTPYAGIAWVVFDPQWPLIALYVCHSGLLCVLLSWTLIWHDGQRVPAGYVALTAIVVLLLSALVPDVHPISWSGGDMAVTRHASLDGLLTAVAGGCVGGLLGALVASAIAAHTAADHGETLRLVTRHVLGMTLAGAVLGWQAALSLALLWPLVHGCLRGLTSHRLAASPGLALMLAAWLHILAWRPLTWIPLWPSHQSSLVSMPVVLVAAVVLALSVSPRRSATAVA